MLFRILLAGAVLVFMPSAYGDNSPLDAKCKIRSDTFVKYEKDLGVEYDLKTVEAFYSEKLDACIHTEIADVGVEFMIKDLSKTTINDGPAFWGTLFYCDIDGVLTSKLDVVRSNGGKVIKVPFSERRDEFEGNSENPYTKEMCRKLYTQWMNILR